MKDTFNLLRNSPSGDNVWAEVAKTIEKVNCPDCRVGIKEHMTEFGNLLARKVEEAIDPVRIFVWAPKTSK